MSRLMFELKAGVFVGKLGQRVRTKLWEKITDVWNANALMIYSMNTEQGFAALSHGDTSRELRYVEGIWLTEFSHDRASQVQPEID